MTRINFYVLQDVEADARHRFACRLISKAVTAGSSVVLHTPSEADAAIYEELGLEPTDIDDVEALLIERMKEVAPLYG